MVGRRKIVFLDRVVILFTSGEIYMDMEVGRIRIMYFYTFRTYFVSGVLNIFSQKCKNCKGGDEF